MLKVIIADDERLICRLVQTLADWDSLGMEVVAMAENGLEALELVMAIGKTLILSPSFPPPHTVREPFSSYGAPSPKFIYTIHITFKIA